MMTQSFAWASASNGGIGSWLPLTDSGSTLWTGLFFSPVQLDGLPQQALVQAAYTAVFLAAAWIRFTRADVLA